MSKFPKLIAFSLIAGLTGAAAGLAYRHAEPPENQPNQALTLIEGDILAHLGQFQELAPEREAALADLNCPVAAELANAQRPTPTRSQVYIILPRPRPANLPPAG